MNQNNQSVYNNYYRTTVGRFYTKEQKLRLLRLFTLASGIEENSSEYNTIFRRVDLLDKQNITSYTESKNYSMVSSIFVEDEDMNSAVNALVSAHKAMSGESNNSTFDSKVDWIIALRKAPPEYTSMRMELALFEYSCENVTAAINELKQLVNAGILSALELLACIHGDNGELEEAFYYYSLIKKIYIQELRITLSSSVDNRIQICREGLPQDKPDKIMRDIEAMPCFFENNSQSDKSIGFLGNKTRRFAYEH